MKKILTLLLVLNFTITQAQFSFSEYAIEDTLTDVIIPDDTIPSPFYTEVSLSARNLWRGIEFGGAPSIQALLIYGKNDLEIGVFGTLSANGTRQGYANT